MTFNDGKKKYVYVIELIGPFDEYANPLFSLFSREPILRTKILEMVIDGWL